LGGKPRAGYRQQHAAAGSSSRQQQAACNCSIAGCLAHIQQRLTLLPASLHAGPPAGLPAVHPAVPAAPAARVVQELVRLAQEMDAADEALSPAVIMTTPRRVAQRPQSVQQGKGKGAGRLCWVAASGVAQPWTWPACRLADACSTHLRAAHPCPAFPGSHSHPCHLLRARPAPVAIERRLCAQPLPLVMTHPCFCSRLLPAAGRWTRCPPSC
jgi:hypothetical protein